VPGRRAFTASLPKLLTFSALVGALAALVFPAAPVDRIAPPAAAPMARSNNEIGPAVYRTSDRSPEEQDAWVMLVATFELVRSAQAVLEEAQSLRAIAAALAAGSPEQRADRDPAQSDGQASEADRAHHELAEGQLALADKVLGTAQAHAANTEAAFGVAWQNVLRVSPENSWRSPNETLRASALQRRPPG
jgi:hypothetical protein